MYLQITYIIGLTCRRLQLDNLLLYPLVGYDSKTSIETIKRNLASINENAHIEMADAISVLPKIGSNSDIIFIDPPYPDFNLGVLFVKKLTKIAKTGTVLIWEFEKINDMPKIDDSWEIVKDKTYGRARFLFLIKNS